MKKIILVFIAFILIIIYSNKKEDIIIPDSAIRFRIIANSNSVYDQALKRKIEKNMQDELYVLLSEAKSIDDARKIVKNNVKKLNNILKSAMKKEKYSYKIKYGHNYFPQKKYKGVIYKKGYYESLVIKLGSGKGDNWWCVLFPPFCLVDSDSNGVKNDTEYKFFIKELIKKYF